MSRGKAVLHLGSTEIIDTFAEAFRLRFARLVVTAHDSPGLMPESSRFVYATSVIGCDAEVGVERSYHLMRVQMAGLEPQFLRLDLPLILLRRQ